MPLEVDEASAPLDAARLSALCRDVLLGVRYRAPQPENVAWSSEESVHAAHWVSGMFLAGKTHWPRSGSVAEQLVSLEHALERYVRCPLARRDEQHAELLRHARDLARRLARARAPVR